MISKICGALTFLAAACSANCSIAADDDHCRVIIDHGISDITHTTSNFAYGNYVKDHFCKIDWEKMNTDQKSEASLVSGLFSGSEGFSTEREKFTHFCDTYHKDTNITVGEAQTVIRLHDQAVAAWSKCSENSQKKLIVKFYIPSDEHSLEVKMVYQGDNPTTFKGIDSDEIGCLMEGKTVTDHENRPLGTHEVQLNCKRREHVQRIGSEQEIYYAPTTLTIKTTAGDEWIQFIERTSQPLEDCFSKNEATMAGINQKLDKLQKALDEGTPNDKNTIRVDEGNFPGRKPIPIHPDDDRQHTFELVCPRGTYTVGLKTWGDARGGDCDGCVAKTEIICKKLPIE